MTHPPRKLPRSLSGLLCVLALLLVGVPPVKGDIGRNGGIIILPCATHVTSWGRNVRASFAFQAGEDMVFQLDPSLQSVVVVADSGAGTVPLGTILGHLLIVRSQDIRALSQAGVANIRLRLLDVNLMGYEFSFVVSAVGAITAQVH